MSLESIENAIHYNVKSLIATAEVDRMAGDMNGYRAKLDTIAKVAEVLGIEAEVSEITIILKQKENGSE